MSFVRFCLHVSGSSQFVAAPSTPGSRRAQILRQLGHHTVEVSREGEAAMLGIDCENRAGLAVAEVCVAY